LLFGFKGFIYDFFLSPLELWFVGEWRKSLVERAEGCVLEVGVGTGLNLPYYDDVSVVGVDSDREMVGRAVDRGFDVDVSLFLMDVEELGFRDSSFDTVVSTFVFCNIDPELGLAEIERVCRDGGRLLMLEHVRPENRFVDLFFRGFNPVSRRLFNEDLRRTPLEQLDESGFKVRCVRRVGLVLFVECVLEG